MPPAPANGETDAAVEAVRHALMAAGEFELAQAELDSVTVPTNSPESMQLAGMLALSRSLVATGHTRDAQPVPP
ncbi:MAG: hypothetical protein ACRDUV_14205 [Pseudonocardiaceae bacterium]